MSTLKYNFSLYLASRNVSKNTKKNYLSDFQHFSDWFLTSVAHLGITANNLSPALIYLNHTSSGEYKQHLLDAPTAYKTINRKLSTLRLLSNFFLTTNVISFDFMQGVQNVKIQRPVSTSLLGQYKKHLENESVSPNTIKGYLSDARHFLIWLESQNNSQ